MKYLDVLYLFLRNFFCFVGIFYLGERIADGSFFNSNDLLSSCIFGFIMSIVLMIEKVRKSRDEHS